MNPKRSNEPVFWLLFGAGGMLSAFLLPIIILIMIVWVPFFKVPDYEQIMFWSGSWLGRFIWLGIISLTAWHAFHRIFHLTQDFKLGHKKVFQSICYGLAGVVTVASATLVTLI